GEESANVKDPDSYFYLIVKGDSMEPRIHDGDLALVHRQPTLDSGELGVIVYGEGNGTLKKYVRRGNTVILQPFNSDYQAQIIMGDDLQNLYIAGKVVETKTKW
ncbi:MAG: S24 family peptidase, partial [Ruthenibacterium sp.]